MSTSVSIQETELVEGVLIRPMLTIDDAIDLWLGDLSRRGRRPRTRDRYSRTLDKFSARFPRMWDVAKITTEDCERFLDLYGHLSRGTQHAEYQAVNGLFGWLYRTRRIKTNPMEFLEAPTRQRPDELEVVTVSTHEVQKMLRAAKPGAERNAIYILAYLGPRRHAVSMLRLRDYDREQGRIRFQEKGAKVIWKPVPDELRAVLDASIAGGEIEEPDGYLVPSRAQQRRLGNRDDRIIWHLVRAVADRVNVVAHVHALRAAFACFYIEQNPGDVYGLQLLMGHRDPATTQGYLRRLDKTVQMESVRTLAWSDNDGDTGNEQIADEKFHALAVAEKEGFEPSFVETPLESKASSEHSRENLPDALARRVQASARDGETTAPTTPEASPK